ncbi:hypothetical protein Pve01_73570 [Planomonospora venezuelensis]|nr:hypothetical protein Pve01_73570 [Planomonospora venezuelensis]
MFLVIGWGLMIFLSAAVGRFLAGRPGTVIGVCTALVLASVFTFLLHRQVASVGPAGRAGATGRRPPEEGGPSDAPAQPAPPAAAVPARPAGEPLPERHFPRPVGRPGQANLQPWRLPGQPGPAGICADSALVGDLQVRAASIVGPGHRCEEPATPRQDAYRIGVDGTGRYLIVAVADGMSDSSHSDLGANVAVDTVVRRLRAVLTGRTVNEQDMRECFGSAAERMTATARQRGLAPEDVRAAVLAAVVELNPDVHGGRAVFFAAIADVSAWLRRGRSWCRIAGDGKHGLDAGRLSDFLPHFPSAVRLMTRRLDPGDVLALTTDGIGDALLASGELAAWFADEWKSPPFIGRFIDTVGFEARGQLDDRTAIVIWCPERQP